MQIFDDSATIRVVYGPVTANIPKEDFSVFINEDDVTLKQDGIVVFGPIRFSIITVPTVTSAEDARSQIAAFLNTASSAVSVTSVIPGTGATNLGKAIDDAVGATDTGVAALVQRDDALTTLTPADGDWTTIRVDSTGSQWVRLTDLLSASAETADEAKDPLLTNSVMYGFDTEASSGSQLRAVQVAVDGAGLSFAPNVLIEGGIYKAVKDTYDDNDAVPFHFDRRGDLITSGASSVSATYLSPSDFTAVFTSTTSITLSGLPFTITDDSQIVYIKFIPVGGSNALILVNGSAGITITESSSVLVVNGAGLPFLSGDVYEVGINGPSKAYDLSLDSQKIIEQAPVWTRYTDAENLIAAAQTLTTSFADLGAEIDMRGYNQLALWLTVVINQASDVEIRLLHKHTSAGSEEYREIFLGSPAANITTINLNDYQVASDTNQLFKINIPVSATSPFIQIQAREGTDGGTDALLDAAVITKAWAS